MTGVNTIDNQQNGYTADEPFEDLSPATGTGASGVIGNDFEDVDANAIISQMPPKGVKLPDNMLRNVKIHNCKGLSKEQIAAIDNMKAPKTRGFLSNLFSSIGRSLVRGFNAVRSLFSGTDLSGVLRQRTDAIRNMLPVKLPELPQLTVPISMDTEQMGRLTGLGNNNVGLIPFASYDNDENRNTESFQKMLFPHGEPRLGDIKQNPKLQDCWFLSSIASVLNTQGTESITRLFSHSETEGHVLIRLGKKQYDVPLGRYTNGSENFGSNSANWVVALENAMQMHLLATADDISISRLPDDSDSVNIRMKSMNLGIKALMGDGTDVTVLLAPKNNIDVIKEAIRNGQPVSVGHKGGVFKALANGISPGHAVSVMGITPNEDALIVLDPYGQVKKLNFSALENCSVAIMDKPIMDKPE